MQDHHTYFLMFAVSILALLFSKINNTKKLEVEECKCKRCKLIRGMQKDNYWCPEKVKEYSEKYESCMKINSSLKSNNNNLKSNTNSKTKPESIIKELEDLSKSKNSFLESIKKNLIKNKITVLFSLTTIFSLLMILKHKEQSTETPFSVLDLDIDCSYKDVENSFRKKIVALKTNAKLTDEEKTAETKKLTNNYGSAKKALSTRDELSKENKLVSVIPHSKSLILFYLALVFYLCLFLKDKTFNKKTIKRKTFNKINEQILKSKKSQKINFVNFISEIVFQELSFNFKTNFKLESKIVRQIFENFTQKLETEKFLKISNELSMKNEVKFIEMVILCQMLGSFDLSVSIDNLENLNIDDKKQLITLSGTILKKAFELIPILIMSLGNKNLVVELINFSKILYNSSLQSNNIINSNSNENCLVKFIEKNTEKLRFPKSITPYSLELEITDERSVCVISSKQKLVLEKNRDSFFLKNRKALSLKTVENYLCPIKNVKKKFAVILKEKGREFVEVQVFEEFLGEEEVYLGFECEEVKILSLCDDWQHKIKQ